MRWWMKKCILNCQELPKCNRMSTRWWIPSQKAQEKKAADYVWEKDFLGGASGKESACQCRRHQRLRFVPWVWKILWRRAWQPTPVFLPGESHGQRSLVGYKSTEWHRGGHDWSDLAYSTYVIKGGSSIKEQRTPGLRLWGAKIRVRPKIRSDLRWRATRILLFLLHKQIWSLRLLQVQI